MHAFHIIFVRLKRFVEKILRRQIASILFHQNLISYLDAKPPPPPYGWMSRNRAIWTKLVQPFKKAAVLNIKKRYDVSKLLFLKANRAKKYYTVKSC